MLTDATSLRQLRFRTDLPKLTKDGYSVFAQLEPEEQKLSESAKVALLAQAFSAQLAEEEKLSDRPLPALRARAWRRQDLGGAFVGYDVAFDLAEPFERRRRDGQVLAVTHHVLARLRVYEGAFAYSTPDDATPLASLDTAGWETRGGAAGGRD